MDRGCDIGSITTASRSTTNRMCCGSKPRSTCPTCSAFIVVLKVNPIRPARSSGLSAKASPTFLSARRTSPAVSSRISDVSKIPGGISCAGGAGGPLAFWLLTSGHSHPSFAVSGITNTGLRKMLHDTPWGAARTEKQISARVSRHLRLLRNHGLIRKVPNRHRYHLTDKGRQLTTALNAMLSASTEQRLDMAA
jgi:hypothetical protein